MSICPSAASAVRRHRRRVRARICCHHIIYDDLIDRLREVLERIPIEIDFRSRPNPIQVRSASNVSGRSPAAPRNWILPAAVNA
jgi:hypothetical protein